MATDRVGHAAEGTKVRAMSTVDPNMTAYCQAEQELVQKVRRAAIEQCVGVLLGERGRLLKLQRHEYVGGREAQIGKLFSMATKLRKLK